MRVQCFRFGLLSSGAFGICIERSGGDRQECRLSVSTAMRGHGPGWRLRLALRASGPRAGSCHSFRCRRSFPTLVSEGGFRADSSCRDGFDGCRPAIAVFRFADFGPFFCFPAASPSGVPCYHNDRNRSLHILSNCRKLPRPEVRAVRYFKESDLINRANPTFDSPLSDTE